MVKFIITLGLPGAGKTTYADDLFGDLVETYDVEFVDENSTRSLKERIYSSIYESMYRERIPDYVIVDIHIPTLEALKDLKDIIEDVYPESEFEIHIFKPNLKNSLVNDFLRARDKDSENTIKYMYNNWEFTESNVKNIFGSDVIMKFLDTYTPSEIEIAQWEANYENFSPFWWGAFESETWILSGWIRDFYYEDSYFDEEPQPEEFSELKEFLMAYLGDKYDESIYEEAFELSRVEHVGCYEEWYADWEGAKYVIDYKDLLDILYKYK